MQVRWVETRIGGYGASPQPHPTRRQNGAPFVGDPRPLPAAPTRALCDDAERLGVSVVDPNGARGGDKCLVAVGVDRRPADRRVDDVALRAGGWVDVNDGGPPGVVLVGVLVLHGEDVTVGELGPR